MTQPAVGPDPSYRLQRALSGFSRIAPYNHHDRVPPMASSVAISKADLLAASVLLVLAAATAPAIAAKDPPRLFVSYHAPTTCPDRAAFIQRLLVRVPAASLTDDARLGSIVSVTLSADGDQILGRMEFDDETGRSVMRVVRASRCDEVVTGMAFVTALAIETPGVAPSKGSGQTVTPANSEDARRRSPSEVPPQPVPPVEQVHQPRIVASTHDSPKGEPTPPKPGPPFTHEVGFRVGIVHGLVGPGTAMGAGVEWGFGPRPLLPIFRVAATWTDDRGTVTTSQRQDGAHFQLIASEAQLCMGLVLIAPTALTGAFCSGLEFGRYIAEGIPAAATQTTANRYVMFWSSSVSNLHVRVEGDHIFFDFSPSIRLPFVRREFVTLTPSSDVHRIPLLAFGAAWSVGVSFR